MSPLLKGRAKIAVATQEIVRAQAEALDAALAAGGDQLDADDVAAARQIIAKVGQRNALAGDHTVIALAGATGSGKSSLFNALAGQELAQIGATRPTTSTPSAAVWGDDPAGPLLDWLAVPRSARRVGPDQEPRTSGRALDGLVLLDLPDFDSREMSHRREAERVLALCDVFVWVTDPQKYADALLHDEYVQQLTGHSAVMLVVLNQVDRLLSESAVEACREDLVRLLEARRGRRRPGPHHLRRSPGRTSPSCGSGWPTPSPGTRRHGSGSPRTSRGRRAAAPRGGRA